MAGSTSELLLNGWALEHGLIDEAELNEALRAIEEVDRSGPEVMAGAGLFAIRSVLSLAPNLLALVWNERLDAMLRQHFQRGPFITKSIYFDKPSNSNWSVAPHQDVSISVDRKTAVPGFRDGRTSMA